MKRTLLVLSLLGTAVIAALARQQSRRDQASELVAAGQEFLASLRQEERAQASIPFADKERLNWHYIPRERKGVPFRILTPAQRNAADLLLEDSLSEEGCGRRERFGGLKRFFAPKVAARYAIRSCTTSPFLRTNRNGAGGWKVIISPFSMNFTLRNNHVVSTTPFFFGANPATVREGPQKRNTRARRRGGDGTCSAEDLHRYFARQSSHQCVRPADIVTGASQKVQMGAPVGVALREMTQEQAKLLTDLIEVYAHRLRKELADEELSKLRAAGLENGYFAWAGGSEPGQPHYYRIQGPHSWSSTTTHKTMRITSILSGATSIMILVWIRSVRIT